MQTNNQNYDLIEQVDAFYNNAWNKLIVIGSVLFAVVGIFVPLFIQWYQKRTLRLSEAELRSRLKQELLDELSTEISAKFKENEKQIKMLRSAANAQIFFSQAKFSMEKNAHKAGLGELVSSAYCSMECDDYKTLQEVLEHILNNCLPSLSIEEINDLKTANTCDLHLFLESLSQKDDRTMFQSKIGEIRVKITKLPKTIKDKPDEQIKRITQ